MTVARSLRRAVRFLVHNWPLKLAAIGLATLLYAGLVVSQDSNVYPGPIPISIEHPPSNTVVTNELPDVDQVRYLAPADLGRLTSRDFEASVDLSGMQPTGTPASVRVNVVPLDPRVTVIDVRPRTVQVVLDSKTTTTVKVEVDRGTPPEGIDVGETTINPPSVQVSGPATAVSQVAAARASVTLDPGGLDFDRDVDVQPVDANGQPVSGVDVEPRTVHVTIPLFTNKESRTLPVNPVITGDPAPGFRVASVTANPLTVSVEGDGETLSSLAEADTAPVAVFGATSDVTTTVSLALPTGVSALGSPTVTVTVRVEPVTETRTFTAGLRLDGTQDGLNYQPSQDHVLLTLFGSVADLDRLASVPLTVGLNVAGLGVGSHELTVVPSVPSGVTVATVTPEHVTVVVSEPQASASPGSSATPPPTPSAP